MQRRQTKRLLEWRDEPKRRPLIVRGARQVGKTWLIRDLGQTFDTFVELNFERDPHLDALFTRSLAAPRLVSLIEAASGTSITPGRTLLFLDEVQESPAALRSLRYFHEELPELHVVAAGSLLDLVLHQIPTGVGRVSYLDVYPLGFPEYLEAAGQSPLRELIRDTAEPLAQPLHLQALEHLRDYTLLGGMPAVLARYFETHDFPSSLAIQDDLLRSFFDDFRKYAGRLDPDYLAATLRSVPTQLGRKFKYSNIDPSMRSRPLKQALTLLERAGLVHRVVHTMADGLPLTARLRQNRFKVILFDTGLALRILNVDLEHWFTDRTLAPQTSGGIAEQLVGQQLALLLGARPLRPLTYWHREARSSNAEVDYVLELDGAIWPLEVKESRQGGLKSLHRFLTEKNVERGLKVSTANLGDDGTLVSLPLYALERLQWGGLTRVQLR